MAGSPQQFCLQWNNHQSNIVSVFEHLLDSEAFVDVTLAVEGMSIKAHKVILSACSPYFQAVLALHPDKHPIVILKDVRYVDMRDLLDFMYRGEVNVDQDNLSCFLKVAESLCIKGLTEVDENRLLEVCRPAGKSSPLQSSPTPEIVSMSSISSHSDMPPLKRATVFPTASSTYFNQRSKTLEEVSEREAIIKKEETPPDIEESRMEVDEKMVKVEVEEEEKEYLQDEESWDAEERMGDSTDLHENDEHKLPKEESDHTRELTGSQLTTIFIPYQLPVPLKKPRGRRRSRMDRQPQDPPKWPLLLPKPTITNNDISRTSTSTEVEEGGKDDSHDGSRNAEERTSDSTGPSTDGQKKYESPGSEWSPIVPVRPHFPMKRPRGRPSKGPRLPHDPSIWPRLYSKPTKTNIDIFPNPASTSSSYSLANSLTYREEGGKEDSFDKEGINSEEGTSDSFDLHRNDELKSKDESPVLEWSPIVVPCQPPVPIKRPRGRPPRLPRQPQITSKLPLLLPKPITANTDISKNKIAIQRTFAPSSSICTMSNSPLFFNQSVSAFPSPISISSLPISTNTLSSVPSAPHPIELNDLPGGGLLPLSVELGVGSQNQELSSPDNQ